ncbi:M20/M25/M40 family metallo-hydrolase [Culicoidibacter larvae]|uniref:M20/M25/M40 family metallo-hydrolase n=1 Tax=Culicoidibacter larvae TaxID=2579976 RepID=A0A5R8QH28_9FIRM|nr:M20/M25/M40 family metallo-hydrolase [Culicoidibacter larvae]TLG77325.1 M20/M25/M40 family metallo-hydrolase [Culicoidibacter larvae]
MMIDRERAINTFMDLVTIDSVSLQEKQFAEFLRQLFIDMGFEVVEDVKSRKLVAGSSTGNMIVRVPGNADLPTVILCSHMDTVEPGNGIEPIIDASGEWIISKGDTILGADDKGGIAQIIEAVRTLQDAELEHPPLELLFTFGEEIGLLGSKHVDAELLNGEDIYVIDGGPAVGDAYVGGPSSYVVKGEIHGKTAHAATHPEQGVSAVQVLAECITKMPLMKVSEQTSVNISKLFCDSPLNVVPELARFELEIRSADDDEAQNVLQHIEQVLSNVTNHFGAKYTLEVETRMKAFRLNDDAPIIRRFQKVNADLGIPTRSKRSKGGTDLSALLERLDAQGLVLTVGSKNEHSTEEALNIDIFLQCTERLVHLITSYADKTYLESE